MYVALWRLRAPGAAAGCGCQITETKRCVLVVAGRWCSCMALPIPIYLGSVLAYLPKLFDFLKLRFVIAPLYFMVGIFLGHFLFVFAPGWMLAALGLCY